MTFKLLKSLCTPAYIYLAISVVAIIVLMFQNGGNVDMYCVGNYECAVPSTGLVFLFKFLYVAFWTFVLDSICKAGHKQISWFLVVFPFILFFVLLGLLMLTQGHMIEEAMGHGPMGHCPMGHGPMGQGPTGQCPMLQGSIF